ncbi:tail fiber assembly protein [Kosakonia sp. H7A]|uniref:tail fiber assembly protein n=1 Tax=Kosakonia sp. H7A TaxID=2054598 RepID=UPI001304EB3E|nr:tail fiber assembly protein [Kosakonia sp. H7A]
MSKFALIKGGLVVNMVEWDGSGDLFSDFETMEVTSNDAVKIGDAVLQGKLYSKPCDGYEYIFENLSWSLTDAGQKAKAEQDLSNAEVMKASLISSAESTISLWQSELLLGTISDQDKVSLTEWIAYIKQLQAVDTSSLPVTWPSAPQ